MAEKVTDFRLSEMFNTSALRKVAVLCQEQSVECTLEDSCKHAVSDSLEEAADALDALIQRAESAEAKAVLLREGIDAVTQRAVVAELELKYLWRKIHEANEASQDEACEILEKLIAATLMW